MMKLRHHIHNIVNIIHNMLPTTWLLYLQFLYAINRKQKAPVGLRHPVHIKIDYLSFQAPGYACRLIESYGALTFAAGDHYFQAGTKVQKTVHRHGSIAVSDREANWAENILTAGGYNIISKRHGQQTLKTLPKAWNVKAKARTAESAMRRGIGSFFP